MMTISRVKPGNWSGAEELTAAQIAAVDTNFSYALDTRSGQTDTAGSTVTWSSGGITTSGDRTVAVNYLATVSASDGEINLYGSGGSLTNAMFPTIQGGTVSITSVLSVMDGKPTSGATYGTERLWKIASPGTASPYYYTYTSSIYPVAFAWRLPKIHGATLVSASAWIQGLESSEFIDSTIPPSLELLKVTRSTGAVVSLKSGTSASYDTSANVATFNTRHAVTCTADQNNTSQSLAVGDDYVARFLSTPTTGAFLLNLYGLSIVYQVTRFAPAL